MKKLHPDYFRNIIFGAEDSLVSTVGVLFGVSTAMHNKHTILLTGLIVIAVEALSMGAGAFLSEETEIEVTNQTAQTANPKISGLLMFFAYFVAGFIPLIPYLFFEIEAAKMASVGLALFALFFIGFLPRRRFRSGVRMVSIAGLAIFIGYLIGNLNV